MTSLTIEDFSCIKSAKFELAPVTVMIGPQGSGKSVTTKMLYFCIDTLHRQYACAEKGMTLEEFKKDTVRQFKVWFPATAWGEKKFIINFNSGSFSIRFMRRMSKGSPADDLTANFSEFFNRQYNDLRRDYENTKSEGLDDDEMLRHSLDKIWQVRERSYSFISKELGKDYISSQIFIPAGRAFFTSIGRIVAAIEQGSSLDPVTVRFAKLFASLRDFASRGHPFGRRDQEAQKRRTTTMSDLFGGEIKFESEQEFVETKDGRIIPFTALSSGQQELLPMWLLVDFYADRSLSKERGELFYIEEPEAHLFPEAQSLLMDFLIGNLVSKKGNRNLIFTTHSPYILSKINNYLMAGQIGRNTKKISQVSKVVPRGLWLIPSRVKAYAFNDGKLEDIMSSDGIIDAEYIDSVSQSVGETFSQLLDIQYADGGA